MNEQEELLREVERRLREALFEDEFATEHVNVDEVADVVDLIDRGRLTGVVTWPKEAL